MAVTYFGNNTDGDGSYSGSGYVHINNPDYIDYVCPGSGNQVIRELGVRAYLVGSGNVRVAIYNLARELIAQGAAEMAVTGGDSVWYTHTSFVDSGGSPIASPIIVGGTSYLLAVTADGTNVAIRSVSVTSGYEKYISVDYTGGFPASIAAGSDSSYQACRRCGVEPSGDFTEHRSTRLVF